METNFINHVADIKDYRQIWKVKHKLIDILFIAVAGIIANCEGWEEIGMFAEIKKEWLKKHLELPNGIPSHDTIGRVFENIDVESFNKCFINWTNEIADRSKSAIIAIDGKTSRHSFDNENDRKSIHIVNAWIDSNEIILGQLKTESKSNEITAIPKLLEMLFIEGCIITIDAMGTQKDIAEKIVERKGDYILALKGNHSNLKEEVKELFEEQKAVNYKDIDSEKIQQKKTVEKGHGRIEKREYCIIEDIDWIADKDKWKGLKSIGMVTSTMTTGEETSEETRYFITSIGCDVELFAKGVRNHWGVESAHWILDVIFKEDNSRVRKNNGAVNQSMLRKIALNMLKTEKVSKKKMSIKRKRLYASMDENYLEKVIFNKE